MMDGRMENRTGEQGDEGKGELERLYQADRTRRLVTADPPTMHAMPPSSNLAPWGVAAKSS
ncbi:hypothetical protein EYF80_022316 [Liparis tanakae]|uniref:Uncharacterized protein n=1 Tax=Liparis tanakae TaxID=230148 RepID=A0A4Z2HPI9_9TELE|nr:hypothetical protein EYF80_022316 [Liparis tanakae]